MRYLITAPSNEYYLSEEDVTLKEAMVAYTEEYGWNTEIFIKCLNAMDTIDEMVQLMDMIADAPITGIYEVTNRLY